MNVTADNYCDCRAMLKTGDIVAFQRAQFFHLYAHLIKATQWLMGCKHWRYHHVGVVLVENGRVYIVEADYRFGVRRIPASRRKHFDVVGHEPHATAELIVAREGDRYDYVSAMISPLGVTLRNNRLMCGEFVREISGRKGNAVPAAVVDEYLGASVQN